MIKLADIELPLAKEHRAGCGPEPGVAAAPRSSRGPLRALVLLGVHIAIAARIVHWKLAGRTVSALEPSEAGLLVAEGVINAGLILLATATLATLIFGRFFCGWACHVVALQDASAWALGKFGLRPRPIRSRVLMWVPAFAAVEVFLGAGIARLWAGAPSPDLQVALLTDDLWARFPGPWVALASFFLVGFAIVWMLGAKGFCTYGCPYGAIFSGVDRLAKGRIRVDADACEGCGHCTAVCTSNVVVHREVAQFGMVVDSGCMKCLDCTSACPKGALSFGFGELPGRANVKAARATKRFDFSGPEELALLLVFTGALLSLRGAYGVVPFLAAIAAAVMLAVGAVAAWRALRRPDLRFQGLRLKSDGRLTKSGTVSMSCVGLALALSAHTGVVRLNATGGERAFTAAVTEPDAGRRAELLETAATRLGRAHALGLVRPGRLEAALGQVQLLRGRASEALPHLQAAWAAAPERAEPGRAIYSAQVGLELWPDAAVTLERVLELDAARLGRGLNQDEAFVLRDDVVSMVQAEPEAVLPQVLLARLLIAVGDRDTATGNMRNLNERHPGDQRVEALLLELEPTAPR